MPSKATATLQESPPIEVTRRDLPLCCPRPDAPVWNMHPRVYLPIEDDPHHEAVCPYCGAGYRLVD
ncbi:zinc-finger domain-containing protein [Allochromatium tepidum]|uniref:Zinc-finger domain-containing protein n=1 Tax=Allochromatium tepidum TaxID=553982 RepID=A0ABN6GHG8_9GAMM|nr:zinc-finger domain-containing protein [Allochromatium tepidum]BCU07366.1 zinc-finger domain-containing protein [Allochromatium tepidum]